jgi:hypothetical protein
VGVIVTVVTGSNKHDWIDFELPSDIPIAELILMITDVVRNGELTMDEGQYILEFKTKTGDWQKLDETRSLDDYAIMDGAYLRIQKKQLEEDWHDVTTNQLEKEKIRGLLKAWRTDDPTEAAELNQRRDF